MKEAKLHFVFPSDYVRMRDVQRAIVDEVKARHFDDESLFAIQLALEEGLINAIKHGNKLDPQKNVTVDCRVSSDRFVIDIRDQGKGFDRTEVPDPTREENLERPSGRGLLLIESYMHQVRYDDHGRHLHMERANQNQP